MSDVLAALLDEIRALDEAATPGPWEMGCGLDDWRITTAVEDDFGIASTPFGADGEFIARARTLLPELAEQVQWMREELLRLANDPLHATPAGPAPAALRRIAAGRPVGETQSSTTLDASTP